MMHIVNIKLNLGEFLLSSGGYYELYYIETPDGHFYGNETALVVQDRFKKDIKGFVTSTYVEYQYDMLSNNYLGDTSWYASREVILVCSIPGEKHRLGITDFISLGRDTIFNCQREIDYIFRK